MRFTMDPFGRCRIGRMDEAEGRMTLLVEPVGHVFYAVPVLNVDVPAVRGGDVLRRRSWQVVAIHKDRHFALHRQLLRKISAPAWPPHVDDRFLG
jgi:hypothetical protein